MKKFAIKSLLFLLYFLFFFVVVNFLYLGIIALTDWDFRKRIEALKFDNPDFELLVLGNSLPEYGVDTELLTLLGIKSYNMAIIGNSDETSYIQLNEYLTKYSKMPKYVIFGIASYSNPFYNKGIQPVVEFTMKDHEYDWNDIPVSKFRWFGVEILKKIISSDYRKTKISYGQIKTPKVVADKSLFKVSYLDILKIESAYWIGEVAKLCNQKGIELIIIEMPGQKENQNLSDIGPYKLNFYNGYPATLFNLNSRNFCVILDPDEDWCGMSHLSQYGANRITEAFGGLMQKHIIDD
jgi:hypothetical protein